MKKVLFFSLIFIFANRIIAQNVGIGTITPTDKLSIVNALPGYGITHTYGPVTIGTYISNLNAQFGTKTNHPLQFFTNNGNAQMTLLQNGKVGIGTESPQTQFHINPAGAGSLLIGTNKFSGGYTNLEVGINVQSNGYGYVQAIKASGSSYGNLILNPNGGNIGVNTTTPIATLDVNGSVAMPIKVITGDYTVQNGDFTIVVDMQHDTTKAVKIYMPSIYTNNGRIIKIASINMDQMVRYAGYRNKVDIYDANGTKIYQTLFFYGDEIIEFVKATSFQCIGAIDWVATDNIANASIYEYN